MVAVDQRPELSLPARYLLVELDDSGMPWDVASMFHELHPGRGRACTVGPGALTESAEARLTMAQEAAAELLGFGLIAVHQGVNWVDDDGMRVSEETARALIADEITWRWPNDPMREVYTWFVLTPSGEAAASTVSLEDVPSIPLPPRSPIGRVQLAAGERKVVLLLWLAERLGRLEAWARRQESRR